MNIEYLKNFVTIVDEKNISLASKKLFIAQPSLSNQIKYLEDLYQTKLMYRGGKNIKLTQAGKELYLKSKEIIKLYNQSFVNINNIVNGMHDALNIALPPSIYKELINKIFHTFFNLYPNIKLNIYECNTVLAEQYLNEGKVDVAIINANISNLDKYNYRILESEVFKAVLPPQSLLLTKQVITINDLANYKLVVPRAYEDNIIAHFHQLNLSPNIAVTTTTSLASIEIAKAKSLIAIVPLPKTEAINYNQNIKSIELKNMNPYSRKVIWLKEKDNSKIINDFLEFLNLYKLYKFADILKK